MAVTGSELLAPVVNDLMDAAQHMEEMWVKDYFDEHKVREVVSENGHELEFVFDVFWDYEDDPMAQVTAWVSTKDTPQRTYGFDVMSMVSKQITSVTLPTEADMAAVAAISLGQLQVQDEKFLYKVFLDALEDLLAAGDTRIVYMTSVLAPKFNGIYHEYMKDSPEDYDEE